MIKKLCCYLLMALLLLIVFDLAIGDSQLTGSWIGLDNPSNEYAYQQLSLMDHGETMKSFYRALQEKVVSFGQSDQNASEDLILETYSQADTGLDSREMFGCYCSMLFDHPEYFWVSEEAAIQYNGSILEIRVLAECRMASDRLQIGDTVFQQVNELLTTIESELTDYCALDRAAVTHDALVRYVNYDLDAPMAHSIGGAFYGHKGVCSAYAKAYKYLLERQNIRCLIVTGIAEGEAHAWNLVRNDDGQYFPVDATFDDDGVDVTRTYFNIPMRIFNMFHTPWTPTSDDYLYPLPVYEKPDPQYIQPEGFYLDRTVSIGGYESFETLFTKLAPVCEQAVVEGKGAFAIEVDSNQKDTVMSHLLVKVENSEGIPDYYFDLYMQDAAVGLSGTYAGLTGEYFYDGDILYVFFHLYVEGTQPDRVTAYADGECIGSFVSLAAAYKAMEDRTADQLTLNITFAENYYLPAITQIPSVKKITITSESIGEAIVFTMKGAVIPADLELCSIKLWPYMPMTLDLPDHVLYLREAVSIGQFNIDATSLTDSGMAKQSYIRAKRLDIDGRYLFELFCNVSAEELFVNNSYTINFRGNGIHVDFDRAEIVNDSPENNFTYLAAGVNDTTDAVNLTIDNICIQGMQGLIMSSVSGPQMITIGSVDNQGKFNLMFYVNYQDFLFADEHSFVMPSIRVIGDCNSSFQLEVQSHTSAELIEAERMIIPGEAVMYAPRIIPGENDYIMESIYYSFDPNSSNDNLFSISYRFNKDEDGYLRAVPYAVGHTLMLPAAITDISAKAFEGSDCKVVYIPNGCKTIGSRAFANCKNLAYIYIPESVVYIAEDAFIGSEQVIVLNGE